MTSHGLCRRSGKGALAQRRVLGLLLALVVPVLGSPLSPASAQYLIEEIPGVEGAIRTHAISGDGKKVVFTSAGNPVGQNSDGNFELFVYDVATKQTAQLTHTQSQPRFNDNGGALPSYEATRIVFRSRFALDTDSAELPGRDLFLAQVNYDGATPTVTFRRLTHTLENGAYAFSGDGSRVALVSKHDLAGRNPSRRVELFLIYLDPATSFAQVTSTPDGIADDILGVAVDLNFYGDWMVFTSERDLNGSNPDRNQEIFVARDTGWVAQYSNTVAGARNLRPRISQSRAATYISNGNQAGSNADGNYEVFYIRDSASTPEQVTNTTGGDDTFGGANDQADFAADGKHLVFTSNRDLAAGQNGDGNREIFLAELTFGPSFSVTFAQVTSTTTAHPGTRFENVWAKIDGVATKLVFNSDLNPGGAGTGPLYLASRTPPVDTNPPIIHTFLPRRAGPGVPVLIYGNHLGTATSVSFGTLNAVSFRVLNNSQLEAVVPNNVQVAPITVVTPHGTAISSSSLQLAALRITGQEFNQGMASYPGVAGKDALVRIFTETDQFAAWMISAATLTITVPSGASSTVRPRMYGPLITNSQPDRSERANLNFYIPGATFQETGTYTFRVQAFTLGVPVHDQTFTRSLVKTKDVVMLVQSVLRHPDTEEWRRLLQSLNDFSRMHPVRSGIGGIRLEGEPPADQGLRWGYLMLPVLTEFDGQSQLPCYVPNQQNCWDHEIIPELNYRLSAINSGGFEQTEFSVAFMPRDRIVRPNGQVITCGERAVDGYGESPGTASFSTLCGFPTTLTHEIGHNIGLVPDGAANTNGSGHSVNCTLSEPGFNILRWENYGRAVAVMSSPACGPLEANFFENTHNGQSVDYPFLVGRRTVSDWVTVDRSTAPWLAATAARLDRSHLARVNNGGRAGSTGRQMRSKRLVVMATWDTTGTLHVDNVYVTSPGRYITPTDNQSLVYLVFLDRAGRVLRRDSLRVVTRGIGERASPSEKARKIKVLSAVRPLPRGTAAIQIQEASRVIYRLEPGPASPTITLSKPRVRKIGGDLKVEIDWKAVDSDHDRLMFRVEFTRDGKRYYPLLSATKDTRMMVSGSGFPGGKGLRLRVSASDGLHSAMAVSAPFAIPQHKPIAAVTSLIQNDVFSQFDTIELHGLAFDLEDGVIGTSTTQARRLKWMTGKRLLGFGSHLTLRGVLRPGTQTISLTATDSSGRSSRHLVRIHVLRDTDRDGIPDKFELHAGLDPLNPYDGPLKHAPRVPVPGGQDPSGRVSPKARGAF